MADLKLIQAAEVYFTDLRLVRSACSSAAAILRKSVADAGSVGVHLVTSAHEKVECSQRWSKPWIMHPMRSRSRRGNSSRDRILTRGILDYALSGNLSAVCASRWCNRRFSDDESYLGRLYYCVLAGSPELCQNRLPVAGGISGNGGATSVNQRAFTMRRRL